MSKAEIEAKKRYGISRGDDTEETSGIDMQRASDFIEGYHQAEKDLRDISWIKEISGVKEMSRAKEEALKAYPPRSIAANYDTINRRNAFEYGYLKAEEDLKLTIEDIKKIHTFLYAVKNNKQGAFTFTRLSDEKYQEVLKRFNERRNK